MANDVTYMYFQREFDDSGDRSAHGPSLQSPVIKATRVVRPGHRAGSVPPMMNDHVFRTSSNYHHGKNFHSSSFTPPQSYSTRTTPIIDHTINLSSFPTQSSLHIPSVHRRSPMPLPSHHNKGSNISRHNYRRASIAAPSYASPTHPVTPLHHGGGLDEERSRIYHKMSTNTPLRNFQRDDLVNLQQTITPASPKESLASLRSRTKAAKDNMDKQKVLLDRYLPLPMGPLGDVNTEVEYKYGELVERMPQLENRRGNRDKGPDLLVAPYRPVPVGAKPENVANNIILTNSFTPKVSDTRKRARRVLCKVRGDPHYFDFQH